MRAPADLVEAFRAQGLKITPQRRLMFRILHENDRHPTADELFAQASAEMPGISLRTVYQTLADLTAMGEIQQITSGAGPTRFDPNVTDHHHAVCDRCGAMLDVTVPGADRLEVVGLEGFRIDSSSIVFHGSCLACERVGRPVDPTHPHHPTHPHPTA